MSSEFIPLSRIKRPGAPAFGDESPIANPTLVEVLQRTGTNPPLLVHLTDYLPNRRYELIYGLETYHCCVAAGLKEVLSEICDELTQEQIDAYQKSDQWLFQTPHSSASVALSYADPIDEAESLLKEITARGIRASQLARELGIARSTLSNKLRLLRLCEPVRAQLRAGHLTAAQVRLLITLEPKQQLRAADEMLRDAAINVRDAWQISRRIKLDSPELHVTRERRKKEATHLAERISEQVGYPVRLNDQRRGGELRIRYFDYEGLEAILDRLDVVLEDR